jgi:hypothetical protein
MNLGLPLHNCQFLTEDPSHEIVLQILNNLKLKSYINYMMVLKCLLVLLRIIMCTKCLYCLYCCTVHSKDSLIIKTNKCTNMYFIYSKTHIKTLKKLLHVSICRSSSGSICSSLLKYVNVKIISKTLR